MAGARGDNAAGGRTGACVARRVERPADLRGRLAGTFLHAGGTSPDGTGAEGASGTGTIFGAPGIGGPCSHGPLAGVLRPSQFTNTAREVSANVPAWVKLAIWSIFTVLAEETANLVLDVTSFLAEFANLGKETRNLLR